MAVPADCLVAVYVPVTVYEVIRVAAVPLAVRYDFLKIKLSGFGEQRVKLFRYILFRSEMVQMQPSLKKRDGFWFCLFISNYLFMVFTLTIKNFPKVIE